ncbi:hypothetical protein WICANDRAFT_83383 [Wickerhamomyces anomalus NRRL Y-366-8]|uniref:Uncharacterized protein n=1 Tax=Wickerhamomyces anomalus (strain ATCC 58044 / CBS 1984 / NCYC 433 / NRRL Y-366-8) TaxID=683960 RepID=A0A1E3P6V8_WICAA|nr:uncharacterized protein WICANDRAFT_83383 [Wickerhamomyces anomalus NRRL Y-366-8]ODQ61171.1 hypothetical protein WICANDRAFT_83383 [Wickerhamomyces anomalus NRRL Y-366-8]
MALDLQVVNIKLLAARLRCWTCPTSTLFDWSQLVINNYKITLVKTCECRRMANKVECNDWVFLQVEANLCYFNLYRSRIFVNMKSIIHISL